MLNKRLFKIFGVCFIVLVMNFFASSIKVNAGYVGCYKKIEGTDYYDCGSYIYTYHGPNERSSMVYAAPGSNMVYAGESNGYSLFYAYGIRYYNRTYDDRTLENNNIWTTISRDGVLLFSGEFDDSIFVDETHEGFYKEGDVLKEGIYEVIQYNQNGNIYKKILIYNVKKNISKVYNASINDFEYDGVSINPGEITDVIELKNHVVIKIGGSFGIRSFSIKIGGVMIKDYSIVDGNVVLDKKFYDYLSKGNVNEIKITVKNYLGREDSKTYYINALSSNVSINFSSISSEVISSSRRIVISADAGIGRVLDSDYCWYYWSKDPDDSLKYEDFLINYANSEYKGSYSEDKGVILRNTSGTYYLYALAKDDVSYVVSRSEGYILDDGSFKVSYSVNDGILIVSLLILAIAPISIYLFIRKKGY